MLVLRQLSATSSRPEGGNSNDSFIWTFYRIYDPISNWSSSKYCGGDAEQKQVLILLFLAFNGILTSSSRTDPFCTFDWRSSRRKAKAWVMASFQMHNSEQDLVGLCTACSRKEVTSERKWKLVDRDSYECSWSSGSCRAGWSVCIENWSSLQTRNGVILRPS